MSPAPVFLALVFLTFAGFGAWTWRKLRSLEERNPDPVVHQFGVRRFGVFTALAMIGIGAMRFWPPHSIAWYAAILAVNAAVALPICLWGGYLWGRVMRSILGRASGR